MAAVDDHHWLRLTHWPHTILVPDAPAQMDLGRTCGARGRLGLTPATTHRWKPNRCKRWDCRICLIARLHGALDSLATATLHHPTVTIGWAEPRAVADTMNRQIDQLGRMSITFDDGQTWYVIGTADPTSTDRRRDKTRLGSMGGAAAQMRDVDGPTAMTELGRLVIDRASDGLLPTRIRWTEPWAEQPYTDTDDYLFRDLEQVVATRVFAMAVRAAADEWGVEPWQMTEPVPGRVDIGWWERTVKDLGRILGES